MSNGQSYADNVTAHEIGHVMGMERITNDNSTGHSNADDALMFRSNRGTKPCKLTKDEWDTVNP